MSAPTGSGKTLAAFPFAIDELYQRRPRRRPGRRRGWSTSSPLRALGNDVEKNLRAPLAELADAAEEGSRLPTSASRSARATRLVAPAGDGARAAPRPRHDPESLHLLLTADRGRAALRSVETVIDEIHAVARDKRGAHRALARAARRRSRAGGRSASGSPPR